MRVLDVDALPLEEIHRAFMYTLVRRRPAEDGESELESDEHLIWMSLDVPFFVPFFYKAS